MSEDQYTPGYLEFRSNRDAIERELRECGSILKSFPRCEIGLPPEHVRMIREYQEAKRAYDSAFERLRTLNGAYAKMYADDIRRDRDRKRSRPAGE